MLTALHPISIGELHFERGEEIPAEAQKSLPPGRLEQLKSSRRVEEITSESDIAKALEALTVRVDALEASDGLAEPTRTPRKRKAA